MFKKDIKILLIIFVLFLSACSFTKGDEEVIEDPNIKELTKVDIEGNTNFNSQTLKNFSLKNSMFKLRNKEIQGINYMLEKEKLARDVYESLYSKWSLQTFSNISKSEGTHIEAVQSLAQRYKVDTSFYNDEIGVYKNEEFKKNHIEFIEKGEKSLVEALRIGAQVEETSINYLEKEINSVENGDIKIIYENLLIGSRNHLRIFVKSLNAHGANYVPQEMEENKYKEIISSEMEQGKGYNF